MQASENKFLIVLPGVVLIPLIEEVICLLDPYFEKYGITAAVTSGVRTMLGQLFLIRQKGAALGLQDQYPEGFACAPTDMITIEGGEHVYAWQPLWNAVNANHQAINPPLPCKIIFTFTRGDGVVRPAGTVIPISEHAMGGIPGSKVAAFDIAGGIDVKAKRIVVEDAIASRQIPALTGYRYEPLPQNAIHCDVKLIEG